MHFLVSKSAGSSYHIFRIKKLLENQGVLVYGAPRPDSQPRTSWGRLVAALRESLSYTLWRLHLG